MTPTPAHDPTRTPEGYRLTPTGGPALRADVVDLYVFRVTGGRVELLQLLRNKAPLLGSWQPVMGHVEPGERAHETAIREAYEEIALDVRTDDALGFWALEQVYPYYLPTLDCIVMSPRFVVEVRGGWEPTLNREHTAHRWIGVPEHEGHPAQTHFMWPGQKSAVTELLTEIAPTDAPAREHLRITL
ncbi:MAG: NUDIX pyrophosphatase [Phycisphaerales bacterium]